MQIYKNIKLLFQIVKVYQRMLLYRNHSLVSYEGTKKLFLLEIQVYLGILYLPEGNQIRLPEFQEKASKDSIFVSESRL